MRGLTPIFLALSMGKLVISDTVKGGAGLRNKHLIIEAEYWYPFMYYDIHDNGTYGGYGGIMYDFLLFMQKAKNFTFTMVSEAEWVWGECYAVSNCTGMIGMVNRKEVDLAIGKMRQQKCQIKVDIVDINIAGPFHIDHHRSKSVDFSSVITTTYVSIIIPVKIENDIWSFVNPFHFEVWTCWIISVPVFILVMGVADYIATKDIDWNTLIGFVLRNVFTEHLGRIPDSMAYKKILVFVWAWACFVLVMSFAGNLTAMITRPKLDMEITKIEDFLHQDKITLVIEEGLVGHIELLPANSNTKRVLNQAQILPLEGNWPSDCFDDDTQYTGKHASYCEIQSILTILSEDFSENGKCNWYTLEKDGLGLGSIPMAMAFQVNQC